MYVTSYADHRDCGNPAVHCGGSLSEHSGRANFRLHNCDRYQQRQLASSSCHVCHQRPSLCLLTLIVVPFILQWVMAKKMSIPGSCRLPNGYSIMMIDAGDPVLVYNPRNESTREGVVWQRDGVDGVRTLQVAERYILGGRESHGLARLPKAGDQVDSYFVLDTETGKLTVMPSLAQLEKAASQLGIQLKLERAYTVYSRYGLMPFVRVPPFGTSLALLVLLCLLARWIMQLRRFHSIGSMKRVT